MNDELCHLTGVESRLTSAYHPQTNRLDERFSQTLQRQLIKFVNKSNVIGIYFWILFCFLIVCHVKIQQNISGRQARLPVEFNVKTETVREEEEEEGQLSQLNLIPPLWHGISINITCYYINHIKYELSLYYNY